MKLKLLLGLLFVAGVAAALAVAAPTRADNGGATTTVPSTTTGGQKGRKDDDKEGNGAKAHCQKVALKGANGSGSIAFTVSRANHGGSSLVGKQVTLSLPAGATLSANACLDASGNLSLRELHVGKAAPSTTGTTTTSS